MEQSTPNQAPIPPTPTQPAPAPGLTSEQVEQSFMPTKNPDSIKAYYMGFVGIIPIIGLPFAITAIIYGRKALKRHHENPTPGAKGHAVTGITLGIIALALWGLFIAVVINAALQPSSN